jgi:hypothetical protein
MTRLFAFIGLLALLAVGRVAGAAEATGWITLLDQDSDRFYLDDGRVFGISEDINFSALKNGIRVKLYFETYGRNRIVNDIELAPADAPVLAAPQTKAVPHCPDSRKASFVGKRSNLTRMVC